MTTRQSRLRQFLRQWLLVVIGVLLLMLAFRPWLRPLEERVLDGRFSDPRRQVALDPSLCLIYIDDRTLKEIDTPTTFWAPYFAQLVSSLLEADVAAVGLDWIPYDIDQSTFDALIPRYFPDSSPGDNPWLPLYLTLQQQKGPRLVQGIYPDFQGEQREGQLAPASELMAMLGPNQLGFLNISRDQDGVLRRQTVVPLRRSQATWATGHSAYPPLAARLAELALGEAIDPANPTLGGRALPLSEGQLRINYLPQIGRIPRYSFSDVRRWAQQPGKLRQVFAGKIVLVGLGTKLFKDLVQTPLGEMYGVEAHAHTVNTLLTGQFLIRLEQPGRWAIRIVVVALAAAAGLYLSPLGGLLAILCLTLCCGWLADYLFVHYRLIVPVASALLGGWGAWSLGALLHARNQSMEKRHIRNLFGRYVSPSVMENLLRDPRQAMLGACGQRRITVLFTDINGFSTHCEKRTAPEIMVMLNNYFEEMNRIIFQYGGTIKQFVGDEIMAMYGAPTEHPNPEQAAVQTAVDMLRRLRVLQQQDPGWLRGFYAIKVGIHTGDVILGNVGSAERTEYAAVGDDVNLGSRLMSLTKPLQADILISKEIFDKVQGLPGMKFVSKGLHQVKGRQEPVEVYQVLPLEGEEK